MHIKTNIYVKRDKIPIHNSQYFQENTFYPIYLLYDEIGESGIDVGIPKVKLKNGEFRNIHLRHDYFNLNGGSWEVFRRNKKGEMVEV